MLLKVMFFILKLKFVSFMDKKLVVLLEERNWYNFLMDLGQLMRDWMSLYQA